MSFARLFRKSITREMVASKHSLSPKRRRFSDNQILKIRKGSDSVVNIPFSESIKKLFETETGIDLYQKDFGPYRYLKNSDQIELVRDWESRRASYIFLRDCLDLSIALDYNLIEAGKYTGIGLLEHKAKNERDSASISALSLIMSAAIKDLTLFRSADFICSVPSGKDKRFDLPKILVDNIAGDGIPPKLSGMIFTSKEQSVKSASIDQKWDILDSSGIVVPEDVDGKTVLIIDDKYQSGSTIQFVASKMLEAGATDVMGLCCVKTWRDSDNQ